MAQQQKRPSAINNPPRPLGKGPRGPVLAHEKPKDVLGTLKRILSYMGRSKYIFFILLAVMLAITALNLAAPSLQQKAIDTIGLTSGVDYKNLVKYLIILGLVYVLTSVITYFQGWFSAKLSQTTVKIMRTDLFRKIVTLPIRYTDTHNHGDLMSRMTNDVENISNCISQSIGSLFSGVLTIIGSLVIMLYYSPVLTLISVSTIILTVLFTSVMTKFMRKYFTRQQILLGKLDGHIEEMVVGYKTVVSYSKEKDAIDEFNKMSDSLRKTGVKAQICGGSMGPLMNIVSNVGFVLIAGFGGYFALKGFITIGTIQAFILYSKQFSRPINEIANQYAQIQTAVAGGERIFAVMDEESERDDNSNDSDFIPDKVSGNISFKNINFSYVADKPVLKGFNLDIKSGQKIAIVGATGSGKTTVVNLLTRFYDIDSGEIEIDGINIKDISKDKLRETIGIVLQDTVLFSDTIRSNIAYAKPQAELSEIESAAKTANADRFIKRLPDGYDTVLSESGSNLSQGQRQLLAIARAVLADPKILILDEATSSVDTRTEMNIQSAMVALMKNRTSLIIAHRLSTIIDADKIIVIDDGRVVEQGNHEELLEQKGCYYNLYQNQFAGIAT